AKSERRKTQARSTQSTQRKSHCRQAILLFSVCCACSVFQSNALFRVLRVLRGSIFALLCSQSGACAARPARGCSDAKCSRLRSGGLEAHPRAADTCDHSGMTPAFSSIPLPPALHAALESLGYATMTPVQAASLPAIIAGRDLIAQ